MIAMKENLGKPMKSKQYQLTESLLAMVSSMKSGATNEETKGSIGSATGTNEDQLALAKVAAGQLQSIMGKSKKKYGRLIAAGRRQHWSDSPPNNYGVLPLLN